MMKRAPMHPGHGHRNGQTASRGYVPMVNRVPNQKTSAKEVTCPSCGAEPGEVCTKTGANGHAHRSEVGQPMSSSHNTRVRQATRLDNEKRIAEGTFRAKRPGEREPGAMEDPTGKTPLCPTCGLSILPTPSGLERRTHNNHGGKPSLKTVRCPGSNTPLYTLSQ